jgi:anti-sigma-K factor RskA
VPVDPLAWSATVWHSDSLRQAVLVTENMPAPPQGTVYQLWLDQPSSGSVSAGLMPGGEADQTVVLAANAAGANGLSITLEPVGGSDEPTAEPIADFDFGRAAPE